MPKSYSLHFHILTPLIALSLTNNQMYIVHKDRGSLYKHSSRR